MIGGGFSRGGTNLGQAREETSPMSEQPGPDRPAVPPAADEPASLDGQSAGDGPDDSRAEATTAQSPPRWLGSAPVPRLAPRRPRWLETAVEDDSERPPQHPTRPADERDDEEPPTPVDPWAGADLWGPHLSPQSPAPAHPQTRPYPVGPEPPPPAVTSPARPPAPPAATPPAVRPAPPAEPVRRTRRRERDRRPYDRPQAPPPGWRPPAGYVAVPVRRRRKWPWLLLLTLVCCCGIPAYFGGPMAQQYPASAALPDQLADLSLRDDAASADVAKRLENEMQATYWAEDTFAGIYSSANGKRVVIFGAIGFRFSPDKDVDAEIGRLRDEYDLRDIRTIDTGTRGEHQRCGTGRWNDDSVVVCTWADHGSIATGVFDRLSVDDSARLLARMRSSIVSRG
jgi:hypothetical protein